ncbi:hypothetical protein [Citrobacter portucalensis]|uniref:hypothetical protein n=1 Tax=Citrobacter portucalensis TaxID=1639133 RepID=UPI0018A559AF|nr:hypothetical protein [Citrobacter portucalensis]BBV40559.1 hypothetical protein STW0522CIT26_20310 [Citrobacter portucalensis]BBV45495.1 hypothetical protein STW0522CIT27_19350 [Citrobacter portucalensis]BBV50787.1 hypothetical protein STW0522CIT30_20470 [Citrobacter portucalensis]BBW11556.1 hypothetical protein STN0717CIT27_20320 [Citrobacter portucalensis]BBW16572.1 hypothetical protein STN0717CIT36_19960 [Citrobacter portucalensis]
MKPTYEELEQQILELSVQLANAESKCRELAAENATKQEFIKTCFRAAADGASMDGADIQELGERLGLFGRETYQPVLHGYICGHEAGEDTVYVMKKTPSTDAFLAEVRAQESAPLVRALTVIANSEQHDGETVVCDFDTLISVAAGALRDHYAAQLRKGAAL